MPASWIAVKKENISTGINRTKVLIVYFLGLVFHYALQLVLVKYFPKFWIQIKLHNEIVKKHHYQSNKAFSVGDKLTIQSATW
jgi:hypothetical protein